MDRTRITAFGLAILLAILLAGLALAGAVWAGDSDGPAVDWQVLSGGGAPVAGGEVTLDGTLGQTAIGLSSVGDRDLGAGFWYGAGAGGYQIYLPVVLRNS